MRFTVRTGDTGITGNIYCGLHDYSEMAFVLHVLTPEDLFVDVGANVGSYTLLACGVAGARGLAFEPVPTTFAKLAENLRLNNLTARVRALNAGAGETQGTVRFTASLDTTNHVVCDTSTDKPDNSIDVPVYPLDEVLDAAVVSVLKLDVEGYELPVIRGARKTLGSARAVIIELNGSGQRYGHTDAQVVAELVALGFRPYHYMPEQHRLKELDERELASRTNVIFVRERESVTQALSRSVRYEINGVTV